MNQNGEQKIMQTETQLQQIISMAARQAAVETVKHLENFTGEALSVSPDGGIKACQD